MNVSYTGIKSGLPAERQQKLDHKFAKISKMVDGRGEKQAHVVVTSERHLHKAEITLHVHNHQLVGIGSDSDLFNAISSALERIEKQVVKEGAKWRDSTRRSEPMKSASAKLPVQINQLSPDQHASLQAGNRSPENRGSSGALGPAKMLLAKGRQAKANSAKGKMEQKTSEAYEPRIFRPDDHERRKPITLEEALMEMEDGRDYVAYRDAQKQVVCMLIRRRDGHYDLIES